MVLSHEKMGYKFHWTTSLNIFILQNLQAVLAFKKLNFFYIIGPINDKLN